MSKFMTKMTSKRDNRVRVVGHPFAPIGMGEHVRSAWRALREAGSDPMIVDIYGPQGTLDLEFKVQFSSSITANLGNGVNIFCINGDEIAQALQVLATRNLMASGSRNVIYPAWELERYPSEWARQLERFDEVWAPSEFIRGAIAKEVDIPVLHMPLACEVGRRALLGRRYFGIRETAYTFLFSFDFLSYLERKNPFAVIEAFHALTDARPYDDVALIIKTNNSNRCPEMKQRFEAAIAPLRNRVVVIDRTLPDLEMKSLMWLSDCFVSLHRSEGFGRGISEAMALGKPVIATAYSGNMDFCNEQNAFLVPYSLIEVGFNDYPHWESQHWADPDIEAATRYMARLLDDPQLGRQIGARARQELLAKFGYFPIGRLYEERVTALATDNHSKPCPSSQPPTMYNALKLEDSNVSM
ncbi:glycosyltransferase family 4 protein [Azospirillum sp. B21]|uniref:glycosyltransferase family 4 protein n=1 Tax=Azospirillum sp. B21 TaxID=2607496 RepID=UPI00165FFDCE|nr:glycosyltransferase family 4 protein [Azospirillum sp. B21]